jgi:Cdc6-like AAA superfamily ATPase
MCDKKAIKKDWGKLQKYIKSQRKQNKLFLKQIPNLLKALRKRWDYHTPDVFEETGSFRDLVCELNNGYDNE